MTDATFLLRIGQGIAEKRKSKGFTQEEFSSKLKIQRTALTRIELGKTNLTVSTLKKIATKLGIPVHELLMVG